MTIQLDVALQALHSGARSRGADPLVERRIQDVQGFLGEDLVRVERVLAEACALGPAPSAEAALHLVENGGKRVRPMALLLAARCFGKDGPLVEELAAAVELVHSATLLHDDVIDEGMERRGSVTSRRRYGNGVSVLSGDLLLIDALERARRVSQSLGEPRLLSELMVTLRRLVEGEIIQLRGRSELDMSEATYYRVLSDKTASLFSFAARAGGLLALAPPEACDALARYGESLGIAFQLVDDVLDYSSERTGKTLYADVVEGKLTLPLVLAVERDPSLPALLRELHQSSLASAGSDGSLVPRIVEKVLQSGSCDEVRRRAERISGQAMSALEALPVSPARGLLSVVAAEMTRRLS
jgi:octaprenyl-diphosphate synthase